MRMSVLENGCRYALVLCGFCGVLRVFAIIHAWSYL